MVIEAFTGQEYFVILPFGQTYTLWNITYLFQIGKTKNKQKKTENKQTKKKTPQQQQKNQTSSKILAVFTQSLKGEFPET